jgi:hypothetical protein
VYTSKQNLKLAILMCVIGKSNGFQILKRLLLLPAMTTSFFHRDWYTSFIRLRYRRKTFSLMKVKDVMVPKETFREAPISNTHR